MEPALTDTLCTQCGLCCDGSLFADVELVGQAEATRLEVMGLDIDDDDGHLLLQPCAALRGTRCSIYAHRPQCCRGFECKLLQEVRRGAVPVERAVGQIVDARKRIRRVKDLLASLGSRGARLPLKERCAETLAREADGTLEVNRKRAELKAAMSALERVTRKTFLGR